VNRPVVERRDGIFVVRDDLFPGGTKARFVPELFRDVEEVVYASPAEGGAQTALATVAARLGKRATIFVAARAERHPRTAHAAALGARIEEVRPGYLGVVQARAEAYCAATGAKPAPFGMDMPGALAAIAAAARATEEDPDEVWCAAGSGVLMRALAAAWPRAARHAVQVGRALTPAEVAGARIWPAGLPFGKPARMRPPFPSDLHYDAKAWALCVANATPGRRVLFWNVAGPPASPAPR
jgi:hypothetical protein